jgi:predicted DNA-binding transcriptional regulator YafY
MNPFDTINRLYNIHKMIQQENTGTPDEFAQQFHLSRRQLYNIREELKDYGAIIGYSRIRHTYFYTNDFTIEKKQLIISSGEKK